MAKRETKNLERSGLAAPHANEKGPVTNWLFPFSQR